MLLKENGYELEWTDEEVIEIGLKVANGEMRKEDLKKFIKRRLV